MHLRRAVSILLAAILLTAVSVGWRRSRVASKAVTPEAAAVITSEAPGRSNVAGARVVEFLQPAVAAPAVAPITLPPEATAITAEAIALQLLASDADLELSARQWAALAAVTSNIQAVRHAYEASIASATVLAPGRYRMEIPIYAAAGDALRARFHEELREQLGDTNADEILARMGARLEGHFGGFGVSVQTLDITGDPQGANADCEVTRTVKFWNSVEGQDRVTTRRETHFPSREDPAGENWGPLLSVLSARLAGQTGS